MGTLYPVETEFRMHEVNQLFGFYHGNGARLK